MLCCKHPPNYWGVVYVDLQVETAHLQSALQIMLKSCLFNYKNNISKASDIQVAYLPLAVLYVIIKTIVHVGWRKSFI